jgi:hypothetical protein
VPEADAAADSHDLAVDPDLDPRPQRAGGDGDVVLGAEVDCDLGERRGRHERTSGAGVRVQRSRYRTPAVLANAWSAAGPFSGCAVFASGT